MGAAAIPGTSLLLALKKIAKTALSSFPVMTSWRIPTAMSIPDQTRLQVRAPGPHCDILINLPLSLRERLYGTVTEKRRHLALFLQASIPSGRAWI